MKEEIERLLKDWEIAEKELFDKGKFCEEHNFKIEAQIIFEQERMIRRRRIELSALLDACA